MPCWAQRLNSHKGAWTCIFFVSLVAHSRFIELSHTEVEAFNLDSGVTQPQLSSNAAAVITLRLESN